MTMSVGFFLSNRQRKKPIQAQGHHRRAAGWREPYHTRAFAAKMNSPHVATRVEQRRILSRSWIRRGLTRSLAERTGDTGERKIVQVR